ncbi:MAG: carbohydrate ABC transporter permease [Angelakisella sp.]
MNLFSEHQLAHRYLAGRITKFVFRWAILLGIGFIMLYPILFMTSNAVRAVEDTYDPTVIWIPKHFSFESFQVSIQMLDYLHSVLRTLRILVPSVALQLVSVLMAGYGFARFSFQGKNILFALLIFTIIVPSQTYIIPQYANLRFFDLFGLGQLARIFTGEPLTFNLLNTDWCFYIPALFGFGIRSGLYIFILRQFFRNMPKELEDAAMIDGCGPIKTFVKIMVPNVIPALVTVLVFC